MMRQSAPLKTSGEVSGGPSSAEMRDASLPSEVLARGRFPARLTTGDLTMIAVLIILYIVSAPQITEAGASGLVYWVLGFLTFLIPSAIVTGKLARMFPGEGAFYVWVHRALGPFWDSLLGFFCLWWPPILILAAIGSTIAELISSFGASIGQVWLVDSTQQGIFAMGTVIVIWLLARRPFHTIQRLMRLTFYSYLAIIGLMGVAVVVWLLSGHPSRTSFSTSQFNLGQNSWHFYSTVILACLGIQMPLNMAGEVREQSSTITRYLSRSVLLVIGGYLLSWLALAVILPQDQNSMNPFSASNQGSLALVFNMALGGSTVGQAVSALATLGLGLFLVVSGTIYSIVQSRLLVMAALDQRLPRRLAKVDRHGVARTANLVQFLIVLVFMIVVFVALPNISSDQTRFQNIITQLIPASTLVLWAISSLTLFAVGVILVVRYHRLAEQVGGASRQLILLCCALGGAATLAAIWLVFAAPWTNLLSYADWVWWVALLVLGSLAVGAVYSFIVPEPDDVRSLVARSRYLLRTPSRRG